jgi:predicted RecB family nuclease
MRLVEDGLLLSASDLVDFLACPHLSGLELARVNGGPERPAREADIADLVAHKGQEYEQRYLADLRERHGERLVEIDGGAKIVRLEQAAAETREAMEAGAPVIYQAAFLSDGWTGYVDFLEKVDSSSGLGAWGYEPADTKLARSLKPYFVIQLCLYCELIAAVQGTEPEKMHVILGNGERRSLVYADFSSYFRRMKDLYVGALEAGLEHTYPDPVEHCQRCAWNPVCVERRVADDHLSLVANIGRAQTARFQQRGIGTVAELASADDGRRPSGMAEGTFQRLREQAALQVHERETGEPEVRQLRPEPPGEGPLRGFARMPAPSPGDVFFDIEGDPFYDDGLEYLWGVTYLEDDEPVFRAFWGTDREAEKAAFEEFVDFVLSRRKQYPDMHVYHYAPYERTALGRMMGLHATREEEVDHLLREHVLVDLYRVVNQALRISRPSYSLKEVEAFYDQDRAAEVKQAGDSVLMFERWLQERDGNLLAQIESYNREDCESTLRLRDWLVEQRREAEQEFGVEIPWRQPGQPLEAEGVESEPLRETAELQEQLLQGVPDDPAERTAEQEHCWLLAQLLDYHRREAKPGWWQWFERLESTPTDLREFDSEAMGGLELRGKPEPLPKPSRSFRQPFSFPAQEHKIQSGSYADPDTCGIDPETGESDHKPKSIEVLSVNDQAGELVLKLSKARLEQPPKSLVPGNPYNTNEQRAALREVATEVLTAGFDDVTRFRAAREILGRKLPRTSAVAPGEPLQGEDGEIEGILEVARGLDGSYLFVQGPPGSGKTYTGAHLILDLIASGKRVGVTANSHKAICNLLAEVERHAPAAGVSFRGLKKFSSADQSYERPSDLGDGEQMIGNTGDNSEFGPDAELELMAGTAWLWCQAEMRESVDFLVVDEAGQVSLADALAFSTAATNIVLLGDPLQLAQVSQGTHPRGSGASVLEHLLGDNGTIPRERGIFLQQSRRMHPDVCDFVSKAVYEGRLQSAPGCELQHVEATGPITGTGIRSIPVEHSGNSRSSPEEAERITAEATALIGAAYTDKHGDTQPLEQGEIMVVTPYNAQVRRLRETLDSAGLTEIPIGTVDKFQGQEAAVVFFSMATSSGAEIPRNVEFLYSRNRLNVAVSRARCLAILVASPALMTVECSTVEQMRLVNALCLLDEMGHGSHASAVPVGEE